MRAFLYFRIQNIFMNNYKILIIYFFAFVFYGLSASAQMLSYTDPGMAYNKLMLTKDGVTYRQISNWKVVGSPYLFADLIHGSVYTKTGQDNNAYFRIDNYEKQLEVKTANQNKFLMQPIAQVDSFSLIASDSTLFKQDLFFINSSLVDSAMKPVFLQKVTSGKNYSLYKLYTTGLVISISNYAQSDLREFDLNVDYYYTSSTASGLKKLKLNKAAFVKEFKNDPLVSETISKGNLSKNPEPLLTLIFTQLNLK